jgi:pimeloyl-ACP methyl ester carboxylesterase
VKRTALFQFFVMLMLGPISSVCAQDQFLEVDDVTLRYVDRGEGTPVLLVHGLTARVESWERTGIIAALVESGFRVVAFDNRGHGRSDKPHDPAMYGMEMVFDIERLLDYLDIEQAHFIGYSMGARLVNRFRDLHSQRCLTVTLGGYGWGRASTPYTQKDIEEFMRARGTLDSVDTEALAATRPLAAVWELDEESLGRNTIPTLIIVGDQDDRQPFSEAMVSLMPKSEIQIVPGTHSTALADPMYVEALLSFLDANN